MIEYDQEILKNTDGKVVLKKFARHIFLLLLGLLLLALPCYLIFLLLSSE